MSTKTTIIINGFGGEKVVAITGVGVIRTLEAGLVILEADETVLVVAIVAVGRIVGRTDVNIGALVGLKFDVAVEMPASTGVLEISVGISVDVGVD